MFTGLSLFFASLIVVVGVLSLIDASRSARDRGRALVACLGLLVAVATRNLLWVYIGFEVFWFGSLTPAHSDLLSPRRASRLLSSAVSLVGLLAVVVSTRTSDLARLEPTATVCAGVLLLLAGMAMKWLRSKETPFLCLGASVALVAIVVRVSVWAPGIADGLASVAWLVAAAAVVAGGVGSALSESARTLAFWLTMFTVGLAIFGLEGGAPALPHVLMHVAASVVMLALVVTGAPPLGTWLAMLSLASMPPLPGFVTKLKVLTVLSPSTMTLVLVGLFLVALGCVRELDRLEPRERSWVSVAALVAVVVLGLFPETLLGAAMRAAALF